MRRRPPPRPERVWTMADMPAHLRHFDPAEWGCFTVFQPDPQWQQAHAAWRQQHQQWLREHDVSPLEEIRARMADRRTLTRLDAELQRPT